MLMTDGDARDGLLEALLAGDRRHCAALVSGLLSGGLSLQELYDGPLREALYSVGWLWENNRISVASEHLATATTEGVINGLYEDFERDEPAGRRVVVGCVEGETHQVGGRMVADVFEIYGWDAIFLGANTPLHELLRFVEDRSPDVLALSLAVYFHMGSLERMVREVRIRFPAMPLLLGGQGFRNGFAFLSEWGENITYVHRVGDLRDYIAGFDGPV